MPTPSRRQMLALLAAPVVWRGSPAAAALTHLQSRPRPCRIRTLTAGVTLDDLGSLRPVEEALAMLARGRRRFEGEGYEVQTIRAATNGLLAGMNQAARPRALDALERLDALAASAGAIMSIGPILRAHEAPDAGLASWTVELARRTRHISFSVPMAAADDGVLPAAASTAAEITIALAAIPGGAGNFRFAAAANVAAGTPFFPVAYHEGSRALGVGLESAGVVLEALAGAPPTKEPGAADSVPAILRERLNGVLRPVEALAEHLARDEGCRYLGIDPSPAPGLDRSIGAAIEAALGAPFGTSGTLEACAAVTSALKSLDVRTCGYAGLMLPVLEDPVLARRASEGRYTVSDLLLYSSVCGTGLDVVPIPGDTPADRIARVMRDTATLSTRLAKPLSVRLLPIPGKGAGDLVTFDDPLLTSCRVMALS